jgi:hypothetical protein
MKVSKSVQVQQKASPLSCLYVLPMFPNLIPASGGSPFSFRPLNVLGFEQGFDASIRIAPSQYLKV